ncbi:hypothetical protein J6590_066351 [Homalodisca vitripennis]|nr:hypothetical protein J6590_066351 [Homalodisca vitripennis]
MGRADWIASLLGACLTMDQSASSETSLVLPLLVIAGKSTHVSHFGWKSVLSYKSTEKSHFSLIPLKSIRFVPNFLQCEIDL